MQYIPADTIRNQNAIATTGPQRIAQPKQALRKITPKMTIGDGDSNLFQMKFDPEDNYLACGYGDGMVRIYNTDSGKLSYTLADMQANSTMPITCLQWRPQSQSLKTSNVLVTGSADGWLRHWHATSGKLLHQVNQDADNDIYCMDFSPEGTLLAVGGRNCKVRIFDETTKQLAFSMKELAQEPGHSNRIFCVKFNPTNSDQVVSGGWDNTVQVYDLRYRGPVTSIYGPHICGECIEIRKDGYTMMTGSYRMDDVIEVWDLRMNRRTRVIPWEGSGHQEDLYFEEQPEDDRPSTPLSSITNNFSQVPKPTQKVEKESQVAPYLYTASFNKNQDLLFCGGAGKNEMRVFDWETGSIVGMVGNIPKSILCGHTGNRSNIFAFGAADSKARLFNIAKTK